MSRKILFRGKRIDNGEWEHGCLLIDYITSQHFIHAEGNGVNESALIRKEGCLKFVVFEVNPETVCQYTGITDMNGDRIFEGDFVEIYSEDGIFAVEWDSDTASYQMYGDGVTVDFDNYGGNDVEITGNRLTTRTCGGIQNIKA